MSDENENGIAPEALLARGGKWNCGGIGIMQREPVLDIDHVLFTIPTTTTAITTRYLSQ
jgi:hypothetical protein